MNPAEKLASRSPLFEISAPPHKEYQHINLDRPRALLVEDEAAFGAMLRYNLETHGFLVDHLTNGQEALFTNARLKAQCGRFSTLSGRSLSGSRSTTVT